MSSSHQAIDGLTGSMLGLGTIAVALRMYTRSAQRAKFEADEWVMVPAYVFFVGMMAAVLSGTSHRTIGYSMEEAQAHPVPQYTTVVINRVLDCFAAAYFGCVKASALLFFKRVFCVLSKTDSFRVAIWLFLVATFLWTILYILLPIFQCHTYIAAAWTPPAIRNKYCTISDAYLESQSVTDTVFDLIILVLPIPKIWSLHATLKRRLSLLFISSTALVALAASIAKTVITFQIFGGGIPGDLLLADSQQTFMWVLEAGFAIIAVNLPTLVWLRSAKAPEQMLALVRSFLSIGNRSNKSAGSSSFRQGFDGNTTYRTGSVQPHQGATVLNGGDLGFVPNTNVARESHATFQKEASQHIPLPEHGIQVTNNIVQKYETV